ncbi:hypothetical protein AAMO2058_000852000 [Amorphochlora amoebiformis]
MGPSSSMFNPLFGDAPCNLMSKSLRQALRVIIRNTDILSRTSDLGSDILKNPYMRFDAEKGPFSAFGTEKGPFLDSDEKKDPFLDSDEKKKEKKEPILGSDEEKKGPFFRPSVHVLVVVQDANSERLEVICERSMVTLETVEGLIKRINIKIREHVSKIVNQKKIETSRGDDKISMLAKIKSKYSLIERGVCALRSMQASAAPNLFIITDGVENGFEISDSDTLCLAQSDVQYRSILCVEKLLNERSTLLWPIGYIAVSPPPFRNPHKSLSREIKKSEEKDLKMSASALFTKTLLHRYVTRMDLAGRTGPPGVGIRKLAGYRLKGPLSVLIRARRSQGLSLLSAIPNKDLGFARVLSPTSALACIVHIFPEVPRKSPEISGESPKISRRDSGVLDFRVTLYAIGPRVILQGLKSRLAIVPRETSRILRAAAMLRESDSVIACLANPKRPNIEGGAVWAFLTKSMAWGLWMEVGYIVATWQEGVGKLLGYAKSALARGIRSEFPVSLSSTHPNTQFYLKDYPSQGFLLVQLTWRTPYIVCFRIGAYSINNTVLMNAMETIKSITRRIQFDAQGNLLTESDDEVIKSLKKGAKLTDLQETDFNISAKCSGESSSSWKKNSTPKPSPSTTDEKTPFQPTTEEEKVPSPDQKRAVRKEKRAVSGEERAVSLTSSRRRLRILLRPWGVFLPEREGRGDDLLAKTQEWIWGRVRKETLEAAFVCLLRLRLREGFMVARSSAYSKVLFKEITTVSERGYNRKEDSDLKSEGIVLLIRYSITRPETIATKNNLSTSISLSQAAYPHSNVAFDDSYAAWPDIHHDIESSDRKVLSALHTFDKITYLLAQQVRVSWNEVADDPPYVDTNPRKLRVTARLDNLLTHAQKFDTEFAIPLGLACMPKSTHDPVALALVSEMWRQLNKTRGIELIERDTFATLVDKDTLLFTQMKETSIPEGGDGPVGMPSSIRLKISVCKRREIISCERNQTSVTPQPENIDLTRAKNIVLRSIEAAYTGTFFRTVFWMCSKYGVSTTSDIDRALSMAASFEHDIDLSLVDPNINFQATPESTPTSLSDRFSALILSLLTPVPDVPGLYTIRDLGKTNSANSSNDDISDSSSSSEDDGESSIGDRREIYDSREGESTSKTPEAEETVPSSGATLFVKIALAKITARKTQVDDRKREGGKEYLIGEKSDFGKSLRELNHSLKISETSLLRRYSPVLRIKCLTLPPKGIILVKDQKELASRLVPASDDLGTQHTRYALSELLRFHNSHGRLNISHLPQLMRIPMMHVVRKIRGLVSEHVVLSLKKKQPVSYRILKHLHRHLNRLGESQVERLLLGLRFVDEKESEVTWQDQMKRDQMLRDQMKRDDFESEADIRERNITRFASEFKRNPYLPIDYVVNTKGVRIFYLCGPISSTPPAASPPPPSSEEKTLHGHVSRESDHMSQQNSALPRPVSQDNAVPAQASREEKALPVAPSLEDSKLSRPVSQEEKALSSAMSHEEKLLPGPVSQVSNKEDRHVSEVEKEDATDGPKDEIMQNQEDDMMPFVNVDWEEYKGEVSIQAWMLLSETLNGELDVQICRLGLDDKTVGHLIRLLRVAVRHTCFRVNQLTLLLSLYHTKKASPLLHAPLKASKVEAVYDHQGERKFQSGEFACPLQHRIRLPLLTRMTGYKTIRYLGKKFLRNFLVTDRDNLLVYKDQKSNSIFYMSFTEPTVTDPGVTQPSREPTVTDQGVTRSSGEPTVTDPGVTRSSREPPVTDPVVSWSSLENIVTDPGVSLEGGVTALEITQSSPDNQGTYLNVFGLSKPSDEITSQFANYLSSAVSTMVRSEISKSLQRHPNSRLEDDVFRFLRPPDVRATKVIMFHVPKSVVDLPLALIYTIQILRKFLQPLKRKESESPSPRFKSEDKDNRKKNGAEVGGGGGGFLFDTTIEKMFSTLPAPDPVYACANLHKSIFNEDFKVTKVTRLIVTERDEPKSHGDKHRDNLNSHTKRDNPKRQGEAERDKSKESLEGKTGILCKIWVHGTVNVAELIEKIHQAVEQGILDYFTECILAGSEVDNRSKQNPISDLTQDSKISGPKMRNSIPFNPRVWGALMAVLKATVSRPYFQDPTMKWVFANLPLSRCHLALISNQILKILSSLSRSPPSFSLNYPSPYAHIVMPASKSIPRSLSTLHLRPFPASPVEVTENGCMHSFPIARFGVGGLGERVREVPAASILGGGEIVKLWRGNQGWRNVSITVPRRVAYGLMVSTERIEVWLYNWNQRSRMRVFQQIQSLLLVWSLKGALSQSILRQKQKCDALSSHAPPDPQLEKVPENFQTSDVFAYSDPKVQPGPKRPLSIEFLRRIVTGESASQTVSGNPKSSVGQDTIRGVGLAKMISGGTGRGMSSQQLKRLLASAHRRPLRHISNRKGKEKGGGGEGGGGGGGGESSSSRDISSPTHEENSPSPQGSHTRRDDSRDIPNPRESRGFEEDSRDSSRDSQRVRNRPLSRITSAPSIRRRGRKDEGPVWSPLLTGMEEKDMLPLSLADVRNIAAGPRGDEFPITASFREISSLTTNLLRKRPFSNLIKGIHPGLIPGWVPRKPRAGVGVRAKGSGCRYPHLHQALELLEASSREIQRLGQFKALRAIIRRNTQSSLHECVTLMRNICVPVAVRYFPLFQGVATGDSRSRSGTPLALLQTLFRRHVLSYLGRRAQERGVFLVSGSGLGGIYAIEADRTLLLVEIGFKPKAMIANVHIGLDFRKSSFLLGRRGSRRLALGILNDLSLDSVSFDSHVAWLQALMSQPSIQAPNFDLYGALAATMRKKPLSANRNIIKYTQLEVSSGWQDIDPVALFSTLSTNPSKYGVHSLEHVGQRNAVCMRLRSYQNPRGSPKRSISLGSPPVSSQNEMKGSSWLAVVFLKDTSDSNHPSPKDKASIDLEFFLLKTSPITIRKPAYSISSLPNPYKRSQDGDMDASQRARSLLEKGVLDGASHSDKMMEIGTRMIVSAVQQALVHHIRDVVWDRLLNQNPSEGFFFPDYCIAAFESLVYRRTLSSLDPVLRCLEMSCRSQAMCRKLTSCIRKAYGPSLVREFKYASTRHVVILEPDYTDLVFHIKMTFKQGTEKASRAQFFICHRETTVSAAEIGTRRNYECKCITSFVNLWSQFMFQLNLRQIMQADS